MNDLAKGNLNIKVVGSIIAFVIASGWMIVQKIILPINNIEITQTATQAQMLQLQTSFLQLQATLEPVKEVPLRLTNIESRISKLEAKK